MTSPYLPALAVLVGFGAGWWLHALEPPAPDPPPVEAAKLERRGSYTFSRPLLECDLPAGSARLGELRDRLTALIAEAARQSRAREVAVYVRDLQTTEEMVVGDELRFSPASLFKLPVVLAVLKAAERDRSLLDLQLEFRAPDREYRQVVAVDDPLVPGRSYSVRELIERTLTESDNDAVLLLHTVVSQEQALRTFSELGLRAPSDADREDFYSVREYAAFFRSLYNAGYVGADESEWTMELLARAHFRDGLVAGVPPGVRVAHKFGERRVSAGQQLHDCGVVYYPGHPYLLCVMSRGGSLPALAGVIRDISATVYADYARRDR
jgi:beta-lactamase class A